MRNAYECMETIQLDATIAGLELDAQVHKAAHLDLDMTRGKPSVEQTDLSRPMLDLVNSSSCLVDEGVAVDNYGAPDGLPAARRFAAAYLGSDPADTVAIGSSSLSLMHDTVAHAYTHGIGGEKPWSQQGTVKFLCPSPGYDRHFKVTAWYGIENVPVAMGEEGPDMDEVRRLVEGDPAVKGIWCVPKYANPTGVTYSDETVRAFASLKPAAPDFRIFWDNAYAVHDLYDEGDELLNIFDAMKEAGTDDLVYVFGSTAKVTFPSNGMAFMAGSAKDMAELRQAFSVMRVSPEKFSQLAHVLYLKDMDGVHAHMKEHAKILRPRFELVDKKLTEGLQYLGVAEWTRPRGGYFVSFEGPKGSASRIVALCGELGVKLTAAGATWPYGKDPNDSNIRIAPTYPSLDELGRALDVFVLAVKLVCAKMAKEERR